MSHPYHGLNELREMFLKFFETKGHLRLPSFSLVPQNDKSILLINAGMTPMKPWFKGEEEPPCRRVCTCQKCIRTGDIDNVGKTARHGTYFEMLGNFSFGDYFKREAIHWSWEFLTEVVGLDKNRLYPSIYVDDDEAFDPTLHEVLKALAAAFRRLEFRAASRSEERAAALDEVADAAARELLDVVIEHALIAVVDAIDFYTLVECRTDNGTRRSIHARAVAARCHYSNRFFDHGNISPIPSVPYLSQSSRWPMPQDNQMT